VAMPDFSTMTDAELAQVGDLAAKERMKRNLFADAEAKVRYIVEQARDAGVPKSKVSSVLTNIVNSVYPA
jgi:hypothetical protein